MPEVEITIGGRSFQVACQEGEEHYLFSAASLLDNEAQALAEAMGRVPESRMLLMAGLMLADKTAGLEEELRAAEERLARAETTAPASQGLPAEARDSFAKIADLTEDLASEVEQSFQG
jgi:cell division protein ZapA